ncbi:MAG TPA: hotdog domain-containing protein [Terriglobia bacterium]|nr:hotdog domain-containing protein [Terriglobia bacterium]
MEDRFPSIRITMLPKDTNAFGTIFGGVILSYIDLAGAIEVHRHYNLRVVTKAMREVAFVSPVFLGDLVTFFTKVVRIGRTSVTVDVDVEAERLGSHGNRQTVKVTQAEVVYVAVDAEGRPTLLAP